MIPELAFIVKLDQLKAVNRKCYTGSGRPENSAEHSWHVVMLAYALMNYAPPGVDINRVAMMLILHDIPEIIAGDTFYFHAAEKPEVAELAASAEFKAALQLFNLDSSRGLAVGDGLLAMWLEFNKGETADARFAHAMDKLHPLLQQYISSGRTFRENGITIDQIKDSLTKVKDGCPKVWPHIETLLKEMDDLGMLPPFPPEPSKVRQWTIEGDLINGVPNIGDTATIKGYAYTVVSYFNASDPGRIGLSIRRSIYPNSCILNMQLRVASKLEV